MTKLNTKSKKGFTIIEVVLVLAIAGLIFLMVFVALPALQRSQRDTQRRDDLARVATAITQYQTNNGGKLPTDGASLISDYLGGNEFVDPDGTNYTITVYSGIGNGTGQSDGKAKNDLTSSTSGHQISIYVKAKCKGEVAEASNNAREYAILYKLEGSGTYCSDNQ